MENSEQEKNDSSVIALKNIKKEETIIDSASNSLAVVEIPTVMQTDESLMALVLTESPNNALHYMITYNVTIRK